MEFAESLFIARWDLVAAMIVTYDRQASRVFSVVLQVSI